MSIISRRLASLEESTESQIEEVQLSGTAAKLVEVMDGIEMPPMAKAVIVMLKRQLKSMDEDAVRATLRDITTVLGGLVEPEEEVDGPEPNIPEIG